MKTETFEERNFEVLFIEDNPADAKLIQDALERSHHPVRVTVARTAELALDFLHRKDPTRPFFAVDLILLDLGLPVKSGWEVLSSVKGDPQLKDIPVLILSGSKDRHDMFKAQFSWADDYLQKPFDLSQLGVLVSYLEETWLKKKVQPGRSGGAAGT